MLGSSVTFRQNFRIILLNPQDRKRTYYLDISSLLFFRQSLSVFLKQSEDFELYKLFDGKKYLNKKIKGSIQI